MSDHRDVRLAADVGGTFTDLILTDGNGHLWAHKVPSSPPHFEEAVLAATRQLLEKVDVAGSSVVEVAHGTTVATNAVLEHRGARTALITTRGFRDVLELRRIRCPGMYNLFFDKPKELIERHLRLEITERISAKGEIITPLAELELHEIVEKLKAENVESVAVCLLHAYAFPQHETRIGDFLREHLNGIEVSLSSEVLRERKEYERTATTAVNAYVRPVMRRYLHALRSGLSAVDIQSPLLIMQSSGGLTPETDASVRPVYVLESGPAAGVLAAAFRANCLNLPNVITFDMGGTTAKASMVEDGAISYSPEYEVGASLSAGNRLVGGGGELIRAPSIDIAEVGAGGGSVAYLDHALGIHVGPRSAGALPGPACYQRGGTEPTVTDANVVLGYIPPAKLADGNVSIDAEAARRAIWDQIAKPLGMDLLRAAEGIHRVANARIMRALRAVSTQRGRDPRDFVLMAFGGSGPVHAGNLGQELRIRQIIIPPLPGLFSAIGLLCSGIEHHDAQSCLLSGPGLTAKRLEAICEELERRMVAQFEQEGFAASDVVLEFSADIRFQGQSSEIRVPLAAGSLAAIRSVFETEYDRLYGHRADPDNPIEIVAVRLLGRSPKTALANVYPVQTFKPSEQSRQAYFGPPWGVLNTPVLERRSLDGVHRGPLLIDEYDSTTVVPPFMEARLDDQMNIILEPVNA
jgi:N-methylhydantoinase A